MKLANLHKEAIQNDLPKLYPLSRVILNAQPDMSGCENLTAGQPCPAVRYNMAD